MDSQYDTTWTKHLVKFCRHKFCCPHILCFKGCHSNTIMIIYIVFSESPAEKLENLFRKSLRERRQEQAPQQSKSRHNNTMASSRKWVELGSGPIRVCVIKGDLTTEKVILIAHFSTGQCTTEDMKYLYKTTCLNNICKSPRRAWPSG